MFHLTRARKRERAQRCLIVAAIAAFGISCTNDNPTLGPRTIDAPSVKLSAVTAELARRLDADGHFVFAAPSALGVSPIIDEGRAKELATIYARQFAPFSIGTLEADRGGPIALATLAVCGRAFYAESPWITDGLPPAVQRGFGPRWLVSLCAPDGTSQVNVAVSAHNTHLTVVKGEIRWPVAKEGDVFGGEFFSMGVPLAARELPVTPERAVEIAAALTGRRVTELPELIVPAHESGPPQAARWRLTLDLPVTIGAREITIPFDVKVVYVGLTSYVDKAAEMMVPLSEEEQPSRVPVRSPPGVPYPPEILVSRRPGMPVRFVVAGVTPSRVEQ